MATGSPSQIVTSVIQDPYNTDSYTWTIDTSTYLQEIATLRCYENAGATPFHNNGPFALNIKYCSTLFTSATSAQYSYTLTGSGSTTVTVLAAGSYAASSDSHHCPINSYELVDTTDSSPWTHSAITFNPITG